MIDFQLIILIRRDSIIKSWFDLFIEHGYMYRKHTKSIGFWL